MSARSHRRRKVNRLSRHGNVHVLHMGNEHLHPSMHQSIDQMSQDLRVRVRRSCFLPTDVSTVLIYSALHTAENILHAALVWIYRTVPSSPSVHMASHEMPLVRMPLQIELQTVRLQAAEIFTSQFTGLQGESGREHQPWGVQTVSAASRKHALPLLFSVASSSG